jgi:hypothetical protein
MFRTALLPFPTQAVDLGLLDFEVWREPAFGIGGWASVWSVVLHGGYCDFREPFDYLV